MALDKRLSREEDERLVALSVIPFVLVLIFAGVYLAHLKSIGVIPSDQVLFS